MESEILKQVKRVVLEEIESDIFINGYKSCGQDLLRHIYEVEKWARAIIFELKKKHNVDDEVVLLAVWLHDVAKLLGDNENSNYDETGLIRARNIFDRSFDRAKVSFIRVDNIMHCVSACLRKDKPDTIEAKILVFSNAIAHMSSGGYLRMLSSGKLLSEVKEKLEQDYKNSLIIEEFQWIGTFLYGGWSNLLNSFPEPEGFRKEDNSGDCNCCGGTFTGCTP